MPLADAAQLTRASRRTAADRIRLLKDIEAWPDLDWFNSAPCAKHAPDLVSPILCRYCGIRLRNHQRIGAAWMYYGLPGLLGDTVGPQPLDAKVLTPDGWTTMGRLQLGDQVVDPDGDPSVVAEVIPQGTRDVYRITFSDGTTAESTLGHLWEVRGTTGPRVRYKTRVGREQRDLSPWKVRTLGEIRDLRGNYAVPLVQQAPDFRVLDRLPVDPYLLGLLLGDGALSSHTPQFGSADPELLEAAEALLPDGWIWTPAGRRTGCDWYRLGGSQKVLRLLGLFGKRAWEKHVPSRYLWTTAENRLALLQGLMDTDGNWVACSGAEFSSTSRQLAEDVAELGRSLGLRTSRVREKKTSYAYKGEKHEGRPAYRVTIAPAPGLDLFRLPRKLKPQPRQRVHGDLTNAGKRAHWQRDQRVKWIRSIEYSRTVPVQCIRVTAPSQLYVTDNWTVTHNSGKTAQMCTVLAMCKQTGELGLHNRAVIVCKAAAVSDPWGNELRRLLPRVSVYVADGSREQRLAGYMGNWEVAVVSDRTFGGAHGKKNSRDGDVAVLSQFPVGTLIYDDIDPMRNPETETAKAVNRLALQCTRVHAVHATPMQKKLEELWSFLRPVGGEFALGPLQRVRSRYVGQDSKLIITRDPRDPTGRTTTAKRVYLDNGITSDPKRVEEFRAAVRPLVLRRTADDMDDVELPAVQYNPVVLDLNPRQRARYEELRKGTLRRLKADGQEVTKRESDAVFTRGAQICSGLAAIDEGPLADDSAKLDWIIDKLTGDLSDEKMVAFVYYRPNVAALARRLAAEGIDSVLMWSAETDKRERARRLARFREDPACRVLVGTTTIEASVNLQVARHLAAVDTILNPARMTQLFGRVRRQGSPFPTVYVHHLLARGTQEDAYLPLLRREGKLSDIVWDEDADIFAALSPRQIMQLVASGGLAA